MNIHVSTNPKGSLPLPRGYKHVCNHYIQTSSCASKQDGTYGDVLDGSNVFRWDLLLK